MVILKCYFSKEHIALSYKNGVNIQLGKTSGLKALRMMENHTWNKQTVSINQDKAWNKKHLQKSIAKKKKITKASYKQTALDKAANNIK